MIERKWSLGGTIEHETGAPIIRGQFLQSISKNMEIFGSNIKLKHKDKTSIYYELFYNSKLQTPHLSDLNEWAAKYGYFVENMSLPYLFDRFDNKVKDLFGKVMSCVSFTKKDGTDRFIVFFTDISIIEYR